MRNTVKFFSLLFMAVTFLMTTAFRLNNTSNYQRVDFEAAYPGGVNAWIEHLKKLKYPKAAIDKKVEGAVVVQFVVDEAGKLSDIKAISGPEELTSEAVNIIKTGGDWIPAKVKDQNVRSIKKQPIVFRL